MILRVFKLYPLFLLYKSEIPVSYYTRLCDPRMWTEIGSDTDSWLTVCKSVKHPGGFDCKVWCGMFVNNIENGGNFQMILSESYKIKLLKGNLFDKRKKD